MALNRTEAKTEIANNNVPSVTNSDLNTMLQNNLADNLPFRKDVKSSISVASLSTYTINFDGLDQVNLTGANQNITISFSNLDDGDVKYFSIAKNALVEVAFSGATDLTKNIVSVPGLTTIQYVVYSKNGIIYVNGFTQEYADPNIIELEITNWDMGTDLTKTVAHGMADHTKIRKVNILIYNELSFKLYPLIGYQPTSIRQNEGGYSIGTTNFTLDIILDGFFNDTSGFTGTGLRGWITFEYVD